MLIQSLLVWQRSRLSVARAIVVIQDGLSDVESQIWRQGDRSWLYTDAIVPLKRNVPLTDID